jgi:hypothetical protein
MTDETIPDDKKWTWVFEQRYEGCGLDAPKFDVLRMNRTVRDQSVHCGAVPQRSDVGDRPKPNVWSSPEYGCHVRDVFLIFNETLRLMIDVQDPQFENW